MHQSKAGVLVTIAASIAIAAGAAAARQDDRAQALYSQIDRIAAREYAPPRFGPARWLSGGAAYTLVEPAAPPADGSDLVRYDTATGARTVLVSASRLTPAGTGKPLEIADYAWSAGERRLLVFTNAKRVWRQNTRGDYWVYDLASKALSKLGGTAAESTLMFAKFSPDGARVAYVRAHDIYVESLDDHDIRRITRDGSDTVINGTSDWVYEEELSLRDGFRWSPDGRQIAYWQFDTSGVGVFTLVNDTDALYPTVTRIPYPKVGTTNPAVRIGVASARGGRTQWVKTPGDPREHYLARLEWVDPSTVAVEQLNRLQNRIDLLLADARTGDVRRLFRDESSTWVELMDQIQPVEKGRAFLWLSERDGWQHLYRIPRDGGAPALVTRFDADVTDMVNTDDTGGWVYFLASPDNPTQRYLYRSRLDGSAPPERVTPQGLAGTHTYDVAPNARVAFHTYSRFDTPPTVDLVELPSHRLVRGLTDIRALAAKLEPVLQPPSEFLRVDLEGGVTLDGWMLKPRGFRTGQRYPLVVFVYGEPAAQTVLDRWTGNTVLFHRALAEAGYIVVSLDNRGTPAPRGAAWRKVVYGAIGDLSSKEQAAAIRALADRHAFIDRERVGIWGWSGGGTSTLNAMFRFSGVYRVGVAVAPVPDQRLYDTIYQERYMGLPSENAEGYRKGSPIHFAEGLAGKLLIVHGSGDDNVHYQGTERLVNRLVELGKSFDLMVYPNRTHAIAEGPGTTAHVYRLIARYFIEHLPPGGR